MKDLEAIEPTREVVKALVEYATQLEALVEELRRERREVELTGVSWWGFGTIRVRL